MYPIDWLYSLDSYTNAEFGAARTMAFNDGFCVTCDGPAGLNARGMCATCAAKRAADPNEVILFRPMRRRT